MELETLLIAVPLQRKPRSAGESAMQLKLSEAIELGQCLESGGSPFSFRGCAIGLGMAALGVPRKSRTPSKAKQFWPWLGEISGERLFGLAEKTYMQDIGDWYFNVWLGRMTMAELVRRVRLIEPCKSNGYQVGAHASDDKDVNAAPMWTWSVF
jgi:hypothetical protein